MSEVLRAASGSQQGPTHLYSSCFLGGIPSKLGYLIDLLLLLGVRALF